MAADGDAKTEDEPPEGLRDGIAGRAKAKDAGSGQNDAAMTGEEEPVEVDDFGLPIKKARRRTYEDEDEDEDEDFQSADESAQPSNEANTKVGESTGQQATAPLSGKGTEQRPQQVNGVPSDSAITADEGSGSRSGMGPDTSHEKAVEDESESRPDSTSAQAQALAEPSAAHPITREEDSIPNESKPTEDAAQVSDAKHVRTASSTSKMNAPMVSEWSHQQLAPQDEKPKDKKEDELEWQEMPALATHRIYDDWGKVLAKEYDEVDDQQVAYNNLGGAGKGYTRVQVDEDAQSATSMDDNTAYLFKDGAATNALDDEDEEGRDIVSQMQTTKELLTEGQRVAYVGLVRICIGKMQKDLDDLERTRGSKKFIETGTEATKMWGQKMMVRLYSHMEIASNEQVMIENLAEHGVLPSDLTPALMQNARVKNPHAEDRISEASSRPHSIASPKPSDLEKMPKSATASAAPSAPGSPGAKTPGVSSRGTPEPEQEQLPAYEEHSAEDFTVQNPSELGNEKSIDLDIRWTVLCDLFLLLIADSTYDSRSRTLLERVGDALSIEWPEVCRFEKRVTDALEMQEQAEKENWNEDEHLAARSKKNYKKRLAVMGLCTVGGGLVIGLSAGLLAPVIGAGLAAGFTTIGVAGTSGFLAGTGGAAIIGTTGVLTGGTIAVRASNRRTGAVQTFEYRPLHNNKRTNLIVTVSGWMTGNVDDVRLPFSTVDPIMGDIYSVHWEPEMLKSTGQTINILATEALTQTIQQILGSTILTALMAGLSLPIILTKLAYLIDNPWTVSLARADACGLILADSIIDRNLGVRPITLVGFSLGSRVILSCLKELANRGALGLIQNVYLFGTPIVTKKDDYLRARTVVSGRFVNGYATNDWILGYLFRATSGGIMRIAGLSKVEVPGIENFDVTETVPGHMAYRSKMPILLRQVGWMVESDEFNEIEDPDPENHQKRQRELINEIEEARKKLEEKPEKKGWKGMFGRNRKAAAGKKDWETYDEKIKNAPDEERKSSEKAAANDDIMFDVEAIRKEALELALNGGDMDEIKGHMQIREIESTLPALKIQQEAGKGGGDKSPSTPAVQKPNGFASKLNPFRGMRHSQSFDASNAPASSSSYASTSKRDNSRSDASLTQSPKVGHHSNSSNDSSSANAAVTTKKPLPHHASPWDNRTADDDIELSFEDGTSLPRHQHHNSPFYPQLSHNNQDIKETPLPPASKTPWAVPERPEEAWQQPRPPLRSSATTPAGGSSRASSGPGSRVGTPQLRPTQNPWAEEAEREGEVKMSFD
ncbi:hypothetical protein MBLNU230_g4694t1 [Neophaeotheca triangularis]